MSDENYPKWCKYDLICDECGWVCNGEVESLVHGDRCPKCEETRPGDEGTMNEVEHD